MPLAKPAAGKKKAESKQKRAGLMFPVSRVNRSIKARSKFKRVGGSAPVYATAVLEYLTAEILELAGNHTLSGKRKRVTPEDVVVAIRSDADLAKLCGGVCTYVGDKLQISAQMLLPVDKKGKNKGAQAAANAATDTLVAGVAP